ncbi:MAG: ABC transporter ATP-binding protein [Deltaproteobacteria bacterium]|nr:ABC transporter ATP-binding protein [Deltaproteobacteria bacterium]
MLELKNIHKSFTLNGNIINVLNGIDFIIQQGDSIAIVGASGAGKSTLMNIMGTLDPPSQGNILFEGQDVWNMEEARLCHIRNHEIGFVFQFHHLLPEFDALENTMMPALISRSDAKAAKEKAIGILKDVGLGDRMRHRVGELSGGEQQRVAIARALIMGPKILLADEPTGNLDRITGEEIIDMLVRIKEEQGLSLVIVTHNQKLAGKMSKTLEIADGRIQ